ncbi:hypothetical protein ACFL23_04235 [Patescibacteria group bacterium]
MLIRIIYSFVTLVVLKVLYNLYYFLLSKKFFTKYKSYLKDFKDWYITENKQKIVKVMQKAGIKDSLRPHIELTGYGYVGTGNVSIFTNLDARRKDIVDLVYSHLRETKAIFKSRIIDSINPFYWIDFVIFLPKRILEYIGVKGSSVILKILQLIWWFLVFMSTIIGIFFNKEFMDWLKLFYEKF